MQVSQKGLDHLAEFEGLRLELYNDPAGHATIGVGHLVHLGPCDGRASEAAYAHGITKARAFILLAQDVARFESCVEQSVSRELSQHQFDALVSLAYNVGCGGFQASPVLRAVNAGHDPRPVWSQYALTGVGSDVVLPGLVRRRQAECKLYAQEEEDMTGYKFLRDEHDKYWLVQYMKDKNDPTRGFPNWKREVPHQVGRRYLTSQLGPAQQVGTDGNYTDEEFATAKEL